MYKIGFISDAHANFAALDALMNTHLPDSDEYVFLGDAVCMGGNPNEVIDTLFSIPKLSAVQGNHDRAAVRLAEGLTVIEPDERVMAHQLFYGKQLTETNRNLLKELPLILYKEVENVRVAMLHYPMADEVWGDASNPQDALKDIDADIIIYGHTHKASDIIQDGKRFINFGSLGCPHGAVGVGYVGGITIDNGEVTAQRHAIHYDIEKAKAALKKLNPPRLKEVLQIFYGEK